MKQSVETQSSSITSADKQLPALARGQSTHATGPCNAANCTAVFHKSDSDFFLLSTVSTAPRARCDRICVALLEQSDRYVGAPVAAAHHAPTAASSTA